MPSRLNERLDRLEAVQSARIGSESMPAEIIGLFLHGIAVTLGGYAYGAGTAVPANSIADGVARALGYADGLAMDAATSADPGDWHERMRRAEHALAERFEADAAQEPEAVVFRVMVGLLDEVAAAKRRGESVPDFGALEQDLPRAFAHFRSAQVGIQMEPRTWR